MDIIKSLINFFSNREEKALSKFAVAVTAVIILLFIDNTLSFTSSYHMQRKLEISGKISEMLKDTSLSHEELNYLKKTREHTILNKPWKAQAYDFLTSLSFKDGKKVIPADPIMTEKPRHSGKRFAFNWPSINWRLIFHYTSSSWYIIILMVAIPFVIFSTSGPGETLISKLVLLVSIEIIFYFLILGIGKIFSYIAIFESHYLNYILNFVVTIVIPPFTMAMNNWLKKKWAK